MKEKFSYTFTTKSIPIVFMENYPDLPKQKNLHFWSIENVKAKFRLNVFVVRNGIQVSVQLLDLQFDYTVQKVYKKGKIKIKYPFRLRKYKAVHYHHYPNAHEFRKTAPNVITIYPNTYAPYIKTLYDLSIKPKELQLYFSPNHNRIEIHY